MSPRLLAASVWLSLATCPVVARGDALPYDEETQRPIDVSVELTGLAQFPDHVFYLYPSFCTSALGFLDTEGPEYVLADPKLRADNADYRVLRDGPLEAWLSESNYCANSRIYALARSVAERVDLDAMTPVARQKFFDEDPRLFHAGLDLPADIQAVSKYAKLRGLHEVLRVLRISRSGVTIVVDSATYRFSGGVEQTLRLAHTQRPALPFKPLGQEKLDKYAAAFAAWQARQPATPPGAPKLPAPPEEPPAEAPAEAPQPTPTPTPAPAPTPTPAPAPAPDPPPPPPVQDPETMSEETATISARAWPLGAAIAAGIALLAGLALARRRR